MLALTQHATLILLHLQLLVFLVFYYSTSRQVLLYGAKLFLQNAVHLDANWFLVLPVLYIMSKPRVIYWFRTDLRLHDSPALNAALDLKPECLYPIWT